ncbi:MAG: hypothetical protein LBM66_08145 [Bifidobacteriaceae bacterium]|jgi:hypothetical protein|nr:hypothetical protein [Bifidobacteriaceae bacterium]
MDVTSQMVPGQEGGPAAYESPWGTLSRLDQRPAKPHHRGRVWAIAAAAVALLAGGGIAVAGAQADGTNTPAGAAETFLDAATTFDQAQTMAQIAPSEKTLLAGPAKELAAIGRAKADGRETQLLTTWQRVTDTMTVTLRDIETQTTTLVPGVAKVDLTGGSVTLQARDGQGTAAQSAWQSLISQAEALAGRSGSGSGAGSLLSRLTNIEAKPVTVSVTALRLALGEDLYTVTVKEAGRWYASPLMTLAQAAFQQQGVASSALHAPIAASQRTRYTTAAEAVQGYGGAVQAFLKDGDAEALAAALPTAEARVVSVYGPALVNAAGGAAAIQKAVSGADAHPALAARLKAVEGFSTTVGDARGYAVSPTASALAELVASLG